MLIQSKKVWIADQFIAAELEIENGKITEVLPYGSMQKIVLPKKVV